MLGKKPDPRKVRHWYVMLQDANDGEVRVTRYTDAKNYDGIGNWLERSTVYAGRWSILHKSQDVEKLLSYARLLTDNYGKDINDTDAADDHYAQFLPRDEYGPGRT